MTTLCQRTIAAAQAAERICEGISPNDRSYENKWRAAFEAAMAESAPRYRNEETWRAAAQEEARRYHSESKNDNWRQRAIKRRKDKSQ